MDLCNQFSSSGWQGGWPCLVYQDFSIGHYVQTFQPNVYMPAWSIGTTDLCHLKKKKFVTAFSDTDFGRGSQIQRKGKPVGLISCTFFN